ncbi:MAG: hypothetical protein ACJ788_22830 [Ktedonobacteraceae bacterium]
MAAPNNATLLALTDSVAQACSDFNTALTTAGFTTAIGNMNTGISGITASNTLGRILAYIDPTSEGAMLTPMSNTIALAAAYATGIQSMNAYFQQLYSILNAFDLYINANVTPGGVNAWLAANSLQVNAWFANAFNYFQANAVGAGLRSGANNATALAAANFFPYAAVDTMWGFTSSGATTFSANAVGANASTAVKGGGVGQLVIYKVNAGAAAGSATISVTYTTATGASLIATVSTTGLAASSNLGAGVAINTGNLGVGSAVTAVSGTGMTNLEQYAIGIKLVRASAY